MTDASVISIGQQALITAVLIGAPILVASMVIGMLISIFQAMTQINEVTLTFVPKIVAVFAVSALLGPWMVGTMVTYTTRLFATLPQMAH